MLLLMRISVSEVTRTTGPLPFTDRVVIRVSIFGFLCPRGRGCLSTYTKCEQNPLTEQDMFDVLEFPFFWTLQTHSHLFHCLLDHQVKGHMEVLSMAGTRIR